MKLITALTSLTAMALTVISCGTGANEGFWTASEGNFYFNGKKADRYIGTNFWYGPLLAADTDTGDRERLALELDSLKSMGVTNLRVLVGGEGGEGVRYKIEPLLQTAPGVYDERLFEGLDRFMVEIGKRGMTAVLYLTNAWEWSGGFGQYLEWAGDGIATNAKDAGWNEYCAITCKFNTSEKALEMFRNHVIKVVSRVNSITGKPYSEDPAIFSWQLCNEPRCFDRSAEVKDAYVKWTTETAALIKSLDPNHMVSTGSEGLMGSELDMDLYRRVHSCPDIDYLTIHIWPYNWSWAKKDSLYEGLPDVYAKTDEYIDMHIKVAEEFGKPLVIEEFGYPRDGYQFSKDTPVTAKDEYYSHIFERLRIAGEKDEPLAGVNFWAWGGVARQNPDSLFWVRGDDYCGDPAQEEQGLYSVYASDTTTTAIIKKYTKALSVKE
ncbi:MAG: cellulase family glycosylhydrolase [Candidatus Cryptobacteroides sp.]